MAKTIAKATGSDTTRVKEVHRLGSQSSTGEANTWRTFSTTHINADGSGYCQVRRLKAGNEQVIHYHEWGPE